MSQDIRVVAKSAEVSTSAGPARRVGGNSSLFGEILNDTAEVPKVEKAAPTFRDSLLQEAESFSKSWSDAYKEGVARIQKLAPHSRELLSLQLRVNNLNLQSQMITKAAEGVTGTLRRLQQLGGS